MDERQNGREGTSPGGGRRPDRTVGHAVSEGVGWPRDLGAGHPLSPSPERGPRPGGEADTGEADDTGEPDTDEGATVGGSGGDLARSTADGATVTGGGGSWVSRRRLLFGGLAAAIAGAIGVGWQVRDGSGGAHGVAESYVDALADNDWEAAGALFHEQSTVSEFDGSYAEYLEDRGRLTFFEDATPSVEATYSGVHITDAAAATAVDETLVPDAGLDVEEWKEVTVVTVLDVDEFEPFDVPDEASEYVAGSITVELPLLFVRDGDWQLFRTIGAASLL